LKDELLLQLQMWCRRGHWREIFSLRMQSNQTIQHCIC